MTHTGDSAEGAAQLARRLAALPEAAMRQSTLSEYVEGHPSQDVVSVLAQIHRRGDHGGPPYDVALLALVALLNAERIPYEKLTALYAAAKEQGHDRLLDLFLSAQASVAAESQQRDVDRPLTLGHRKVQARGGNREMLTRLLRHPELEVIPHLLQNPRLTEHDVVTLAARRPANPALQRQIAETSRWVSRYRIKRALVLNPHTPSDVSVRLLPFLLATDLKIVAGSSGLAQLVREAAEELSRRPQADLADDQGGSEDHR